LASAANLKANLKSLKKNNRDLGTHSVNWYLPHANSFKPINQDKKIKDCFKDVRAAYRNSAKKSESRPENIKNNELVRIERFVSYDFFRKK